MPVCRPFEEPLVRLGRGERDQPSVDLHVEHVPGTEHHERHLGGVGGRSRRPLSSNPTQSAKERPNEVRSLRTSPSVRTPQPSLDPSLIVKVDSMPSGRLTARECAWLSPTIVTRRGNVGKVVVGAVLAGASVTEGVES